MNHPNVTTRWTPDGLVALVMDVETARQVRQVVYENRRASPGLDKAAECLDHTLDVKREPHGAES